MGEAGVSETGSISAEKKSEDKLVRPTLYIGIGGTGASILTALRRRIMQTLWNGHRLESLQDFKVASFIYFDTFAGPAKDQEARRKENEVTDPLAPLVALPKGDCIQAGLDPAKYLKQDPVLGTAELNNYPYVKAWLPADELSTINLEEGAGQIRSMSRLLFFDRIADINNLIATRLRQLRNNLQEKKLLQDQGLKTIDKVNVKIVGSAAGGTGSGSFIDMGYLAKSMRDPRPEEVSLWLVLGGAFAGQGSRVLANTYAAMAELEYAMKLRYSDPDFVETWDGRLKPLDKRPFDRLFLFDSTNVQNVGVNMDGRDYVFRMIADLLLQDLAEPDLVGARRGDQSNQDTKYREPMYVPTVTRTYQGQGLEFSRLYSGMGQSTVETQARIAYQAEAALVAGRMLKSYFRIEETESEPPKPAAVEAYLHEKLFLGPPRQFVVHKDIRNPPVLSDYPLVFSKLLLAADGSSLLQSVQNDVNVDFQRLTENPKLGEWPTLAQDISKRRRTEIEQESAERDRQGLTIRVAAVENACRQLVAQVTGSDGMLRRTMLDLVDSDVGGIFYAYAFIDALKSRIKAYWIPLFTRDADTYAQLAQKIMSALYQQAAENLQSEAKGGLMSGPNRQRMLTIVNQMKETLTIWMQYRLRQIACKKAVDLLTAVSTALGEQAGAGADGKPSYTGVLREIHEGEDTVLAAIKELETEAAVILDPDTAKNPIHQVIASKEDKNRLASVVVDPATYRITAASAFKDYGGATRIFGDLRDRGKRAVIVSRLRRVASEEVGPSGVPVLMPEDNVPSLISDLASLPQSQQLDILNDAVKQAMPWVNIDTGQVGEAWKPDMCSVFVCVRDSQTFKAQFGDKVRDAVSNCGGIGKEINFVETTSQGRLVICTELSGLPLDALKQLHHDWERNYDQLREDPQQAPLHTHMMWEKFGRPTAPDTGQLKARLNDIGLFVQGVAFGVLRRRVGEVPASRKGQYEINLTAGLTKSNWVPIGRELKIRNFGLKPEHQAELQKALQLQLADLSPPQLMAALALFEFYSQHHYSPRLVGDSERTGLGHLASNALMQEFKKRFEETAEGRRLVASDENAVKKQATALIAAIDEWTEEISGSLDDVDNRESNKDDPERMALQKRVIRKDVFADEAVLRRLTSGRAPAPRGKAAALNRQFWYVGPDGKPAPRAVDVEALADLAAKGVVTHGTKLCEKGTKAWRSARDWPELADLFEMPPPLGDEDGPPPLT